MTAWIKISILKITNTMVVVLKEWIKFNHTNITFGYGQVFFIIGLAIFLQSRRYPRLELAGNLRWIAAFGLMHGFHEWGDVFISIQVSFLSSAIIIFLRILQLLLLAGSFTCLLGFAGGLLQQQRQFNVIPAGVFLFWLISSAFLGFLMNNDLGQWRSSAEVLARYFIGFPGAIISAYMLNRYAQTRISPLDLPQIYRAFRISSLSLGAYGLFSGLIGPPAHFFPASVINVETFTELFIFPPLVFRSICGLIFIFFIVRALDAFEIETNRLVGLMEREAVAVVERKRAARDLHDTTFQRLYAAGLIAQSLKRKYPNDAVVESDLNRLMLIINEVITELQTFLLGLITTENSTDISSAVQSVIEEARNSSGLEVSWITDSHLTLSANRVSHVVSFLRECLSNVVRHSQARSAEVKLSCRNNRLYLSIDDDGRGLPDNVNKGYGMRDMLDRARLLGGKVSFTSQNRKGTTVTLDIPMKDER
ncbi:MAG: ATP-binding protein [Spirochaetota bacterium]